MTLHEILQDDGDAFLFFNLPFPVRCEILAREAMIPSRQEFYGAIDVMLFEYFFRALP